MDIQHPEQLAVEVVAQRYFSGQSSADHVTQEFRVLREQGNDVRANRLAAFYLGGVAADQRNAGEAEAMYRIAIDPAHPDIAAGAALNLALVLCVLPGRRAEGEQLLRQAERSGHPHSMAAARKTLADLRAGTWPTAEDLALFGTPPAAEPKAKWWQREARRPERDQKAQDRRRALRAEIATGWNGVRWGDTVDAFKARFPQAQPKDTWWLTGGGKETFCGVRMDAQYAFNPQGRFYLVAFYPAVHDRTLLSLAPSAEFGDPPGSDLSWPMSADVVVDVKGAGVAASIFHRGLMP